MTGAIVMIFPGRETSRVCMVSDSLMMCSVPWSVPIQKELASGTMALMREFFTTSMQEMIRSLKRSIRTRCCRLPMINSDSLEMSTEISAGFAVTLSFFFLTGSKRASLSRMRENTIGFIACSFDWMLGCPIASPVDESNTRRILLSLNRTSRPDSGQFIHNNSLVIVIGDTVSLMACQSAFTQSSVFSTTQMCPSSEKHHTQSLRLCMKQILEAMMCLR
mmetsp:Transcript_15934/g.40841  ORF Transcript_15934/g.40841 Transcript_15934/m.40841 type:complete len:220 (+) Transcript_15934:725-1384(+)